jgi:hypothetical protein
MRVQIQLAPELWQHLCETAEANYRNPKQQAAYLIQQALAQADHASTGMASRSPSQSEVQHAGR